MVRKVGRRVCSGLRLESHPTHSELHTGYRAVGRRADGQPGDKTAQKVGSAQSSSGLSNMQQAEVLNPRVANQACEDNTNFTLVLGGPLYQLYLRTKLARPTLELVPRRVASIALICWLPLLVLSLLNGSALGGVAVPFLLDLGVYTRFLGALPLMVAAELIVYQRLSPIVQQFLDRGIVLPQDRARFSDLVASAKRLQSSALAEGILFVAAITIGHWVWKENMMSDAPTWFASSIGRGQHLTLAGCWYAFVSLPILRFILLRWYFRLFVWYRFLWQVRALPLHFHLFHPDRAGGIGFLSGSVSAFAPVLVAQTILLTGIIGDRIWHAGATLPTFKMEIAEAVAFLMLLVLIPLTFFLFGLEEAGRKAKREYGILASRYVEDFRCKWIQGQGTEGDRLLGTSDIQSLADLGNAYSVVSDMRLVPISKSEIIRLAVSLIFPILPLTLTMVPLDKIIDRLIKLVF